LEWSWDEGGDGDFPGGDEGKGQRRGQADGETRVK
jgi:hypothetical protein